MNVEKEHNMLIYVMQVHYETCPNMILHTDCTKNIKRQEVDKHVDTEREFTVIACKGRGCSCQSSQETQGSPGCITKCKCKCSTQKKVGREECIMI